MSLPTLPDLTPQTYRWHSSPDSPHTVRRLANGTEAWVGIKAENAKGQYDFYINTSLRIANTWITPPSATLPLASPVASLSLAGLKEKLAVALVLVGHAEIGCLAVWPEDGGVTPWIEYVMPRTTGEALARARATVEVRVGGLSGFDLRAQLEAQRRGGDVPEPAASVRLYLLADVVDETVPLREGTGVELLAHFNHVFWDGISARMIVGELFVLLGQTMEWDQERVLSKTETEWSDVLGMGLSEPILDVCKVDVEALAHDDEFKKAREEFIGVLMESGSSWGLPVTDAEGTPRTEWYRFSTAESEAIIRAVKTRIGPQYTISHLGHAATVLALLKARPLPSGDTTTKLITALPVNGRYFLHGELAEGNFLQDEFADVQYGACQARAVVEFPQLGQWTVDENDETAVKAALEGLSKHIKQSYDYWLSKPFQLALCVSKDNFLSSFLSSKPPSFSDSSIPIFASDGIVDRYVPGEIMGSFGNTLMTVEACSFLLDTYNDSLLIRMESWKGATSLSFCFNDGYFKSEDAARFLKDMAGFMLTFAE
ncbi:15-O-acetyltransferase Tri3 [Coniochaeta ligniaria NRRL 30616]|uniref:15-O-acetyltransferase Tri3 n=1 Tax=Coniochaeta ligniaria NRRL 30616 TaxID=1408157 RepID=A0A1J7ICV4_9PEZI|nr:15-O-acetyltransferase Tri3 [Coniochaeta ligniaria NRRL 30616]